LTEQDQNNVDWETQSPEEQKSLLGDYRVDLPVFEGPLDLLLHLIRKHEIDIFDIPVAMILDKYMAYIEWMQVLNLDIAGEFLVMASTLSLIKSKMLLPPGEGEDEEEEEEEGDPRAELVKRLLEYQRYKDAANELRDRPILSRDVFAREVKQHIPVEEDGAFAEVSVFKLIEALDKVMRKASKRVTHEVLMERISIAARIQELVEYLASHTEVTFEEIFGENPTKSMIIITFISLLEMARLRMVRLHQAQESQVLYVKNLCDQVDIDEVMALVKNEKL
jgi:segregation and condensation protein A